MKYLQKQSALGLLLRRVVIPALLALPIVMQAQESSGSALDAGYRDMYNLQFDQAHRAFAHWHQTHPDDPMGPVSDAAAFLFSEFDRLHILEMEFFVNDKNFDNQPRLAADENVKQQFEAQLSRGQALAQTRLARDPHDSNAAFAEVLMGGLRGDYAALIEKRNMAGLSFMKQSRAVAENLVAARPDYYDAYLAIGVENYLLSLKAAPLRWLLHMGGAETDRDTGLKNLRVTAEKGHFLAPFARLLLAVASLRDGDRKRAQSLLSGLATEFPSNRLYARELAQLH